LTGLIDNPAADLADNRSPRSNLRRVNRDGAHLRTRGDHLVRAGGRSRWRLRGLAAIGGPIVEAVLAWTGVFRYADDSDALFGVGPWLPALYFAFGVVVALLGEIAAKNRQPSIGPFDPGIPASR